VLPVLAGAVRTAPQDQLDEQLALQAAAAAAALAAPHRPGHIPAGPRGNQVATADWLRMIRPRSA
jgi:hypothetical protein